MRSFRGGVRSGVTRVDVEVRLPAEYVLGRSDQWPRDRRANPGQAAPSRSVTSVQAVLSSTPKLATGIRSFRSTAQLSIAVTALTVHDTRISESPLCPIEQSQGRGQSRVKVPRFPESGPPRGILRGPAPVLQQSLHHSEGMVRIAAVAVLIPFHAGSTSTITIGHLNGETT
jgi:hypothetical protein